MTVAPHSPPLHAEDIDAAAALLRDRGMRVSAARRLVLQALFAAEHPIRAEEIADGLGGALPRTDVASVYRNRAASHRAAATAAWP
jgi:Fe2+ or Zn2+ uptake regulation protein